MEGILFDLDMLNVLSQPRYSADIVVILTERAQVDIDPKFKDPNWYKVETATHCIGYVPKRFIAIRS